ncbi:MAG: glycosyltransferase family 2 protein [Gemmatimonadales bacterium]
MGAGDPLVSVVLASHARPGLIGQALASLVAQTVRDREIIVVDNHSELSAEIARIVAGYPEVRLIASSENLGFPGGVNLGLRAARGLYVFITEDDIVLPPECLATLSAYMEAHPEVGIATGRLVEGSTNVVLYAGGDATLDAVFRMRFVGRGEPDRAWDAAPVPVTYAPVGMVMVRREMLDRIGELRGDFFMYYEDVEFCLRALVAGYGVMCLPQLRLVHHASPPTGDAARVEFHKLKNMRALYLLLAPARVLPEFTVRYGLIEPARELLRDRTRWLRMVRAWGWVLAHLPGLLRDRRRIARLRAEGAA